MAFFVSGLLLRNKVRQRQVSCINYNTKAMEQDKETREDVYQQFNDMINMAPAEIEDWLQTEESKSVGQDSGDGESIGHKSGKKIVDIKRSKKADLTDNDYEHMQKVVSYISRHSAQRPSHDVETSNWRYSLKNWGHDPMK